MEFVSWPDLRARSAISASSGRRSKLRIDVASRIRERTPRGANLALQVREHRKATSRDGSETPLRRLCGSAALRLVSSRSVPPCLGRVRIRAYPDETRDREDAKDATASRFLLDLLPFGARVAKRGEAHSMRRELGFASGLRDPSTREGCVHVRTEPPPLVSSPA
jgi:hypothetical protein